MIMKKMNLLCKLLGHKIEFTGGCGKDLFGVSEYASEFSVYECVRTNCNHIEYEKVCQ